MNTITHETIMANGRYRDLSLDGVETATVSALHAFMLRLRMCEEALIAEYHPADEMRCPVHFCVGQEAVPAALSLLIKDDDYLFSHHRTHGFYLAKGAPMESLFAEMYGRETGANGGMAGSQDISLTSSNFYSGAILAGAVGIATGAAMGFQQKGTSQVAVAGFGDGAMDEGVLWEALNYAALRSLPVVFLCENNGYATYSPQLKRQPADNVSSRVAAFGVPTHTLFGNDAVAVHKVVAAAIDHARSGKGPTFIETYTYRWYGHVGPEDDDYLGYRPESELKFWKDNCPIALLEEQMVQRGLLTTVIKSGLENKINGEIARAFNFAKTSAFPTVDSWEVMNYSLSSPLADRLLADSHLGDFDHSQADAIPRPY